MKAFINIELQEGETLLQAIDALIAGAKPTCSCAPTDKPATTKTAAHEEPEEDPAMEEKTDTHEEPVKESAKTTKAKKAKKAAEPADGPGFEDVRAAAMKAINAGKRTEVEAVLEEHGGKLKDVDPANYPDVLAKLEELI